MPAYPRVKGIQAMGGCKGIGDRVASGLDARKGPDWGKGMPGYGKGVGVERVGREDKHNCQYLAIIKSTLRINVYNLNIK